MNVSIPSARNPSYASVLPTSAIHVPEASSSQYNPALYPPAHHNPYLQNNFTYHCSHPGHLLTSQSSHSSLSTNSLAFNPHPCPLQVQFPPNYPPHFTPGSQQIPIATNPQDNSILLDLRNSIDAFHHTINDLRQELVTVRSQLNSVNTQNQHSQLELLALARHNNGVSQPFHHSMSSRPPSVPPIIETMEPLHSPSPASHTSIPNQPSPNNNPLVSDPVEQVTTLSQHSTQSQDPIVTAMLATQNKMIQNQDRLLSSLLIQSKVTNKKKPPSTSNFPTLSDAHTTRETSSGWYNQILSIIFTEN